MVFTNGSTGSFNTTFNVGGSSSSGGSSSGGGSSNNGVSVPARIEAENFIDYNDTTPNNNIGGAFRNTGVDIQSCNDPGCGFNVGWTAGGEWLEYEIDVNNFGNYQANLRVAQRNNGAVMSIDVDGQNRTGNISIPTTGAWQNYTTRTVDLGNLSNGSHTVRVNFENGGVNLNWFEIEGGGGSSSPSPTPQPSSNVNIVVSNSSNRSNASNLNGQEVDGNIFVLVSPDNNVDRVQYFIDNNFVKTENVAPFNLQGGPSSGANPFGTDDLSNGNHTLRAEILFNNGSTDTISANFSVDNGGSSSGGGSSGGSGQFGLNPNDEPWENFDLSDWALDSPEGRSSNQCQSRRVDEDEWDEVPGTDTHDYIFTHTDGGMRFVSPVGGSTTSSSCNSGFPRSELREMLRAGNTSISTTGVNPNNWALGYQPSGGNWGGRNGELKATLRVNRVTTTGDGLHPGRVIIGQIHADDDEPLRLYYRKLPGADRGCIYAESEIRNGDDVTFNMIGNEQCSGNGPSNGIALDELFSYEIRNLNEDIRVRIRRGDQDGPIIDTVTIDLDDLDSGYDHSDEWMYFKAGAYTQNNTGNDNDTDVITFYRLSNTHVDN